MYIKRICYTRPLLPKQSTYESFLESIWKTKNLTNNGPLLQELEKK